MEKFHLTGLKKLYKLDINDCCLPFVFHNSVYTAMKNVATIWDQIKDGKCENVILTPALPRGNVNAEIMIVGQNPGGRGKEDRKYTTMWNDGPNSKFILDVVNQANIADKVWFTNLVPYPTQDNKITKKQIEETRHLFDLQLEIIKPKVLIGLGGVVNKQLKNEYSDKYFIIEMAHPSYVRRFLSGNPANKIQYIAGFNSALKFLKDDTNESVGIS